MVSDDAMTRTTTSRGTAGGLGSASRRSSLIRLAALAVPAMLGSRLAMAQSGFPNGPMRIVVPFSGGSPPDNYCRVFGEKLSQRIGQPVVIDLRPGASTTIGTAYAAKVKPDGQTIAYLTNSSLTAAPGLFKALQYDPENDFSAITVMLESYFCICVRPEDAGLTVQALAERIRKDPGGNPMAGGSSTAEVSNMLFQKAAKLEHSYARYNSNQQYNDLWGGRLNAVWAPLGSAITMANQGKVHILAITGPQRVSVLPNVPTLSEVYPDVVVESWSGFFVPKGTPRELVHTLYEHVDGVVRDPEIQERSRLDGTRALKMSPEESDAYVQKDFPRWRELLTSAGIEAQ